jgi:hypothetical protein
MIKIEKDDEKVIVKFSYNPDYITKIKTIEGYRWHPLETDFPKGMLADFPKGNLIHLR